MKYEELGRGIVRRAERRVLGLFIDGTGLDHATRRLNRKVEMSSLVRGVTSGASPVVARYYTLIPHEDDSRQRAFLDAVSRAGLQVVVKRLPPKGVTRHVAVDVEMAADLVAFALGHSEFSSLSQYMPEGSSEPREGKPDAPDAAAAPQTNGREQKIVRVATVVCPSRELAYPISLLREFGVDTVTADFGKFAGGDVLKSAAKWIDLSDSETIWRE